MGCMWDVTFNELAPSHNDTNYIKTLLLQNVVVSTALLQRSLVRGTGVDALQPLVDGRVFPLCQALARDTAISKGKDIMMSAPLRLAPAKNAFVLRCDSIMEKSAERLGMM